MAESQLMAISGIYCNSTMNFGETPCSETQLDKDMQQP